MSGGIVPAVGLENGGEKVVRPLCTGYYLPATTLAVHQRKEVTITHHLY